jgi:hypothetical protein
MALSLTDGWPYAIAYLGPPVMVIGPEPSRSPGSLEVQTLDVALRYVVETALEDHIFPLISALRLNVCVAQRLLLANTAARAAGSFQNLQQSVGTWVMSVAQRFFETAAPSLRGLGSYVAIEQGSGQGLFWERTSCCMYDRLPGKNRCRDCSLTPADQRRTAFAAALASFSSRGDQKANFPGPIALG